MGLEEFKKHLTKYLTNEEIERLVNSFSLPQPHGIFLNNNVTLDEDFIKEFELVQNKYIPRCYYTYKEGLGKTLYHDFGAYYIQESSSSFVPAFLGIKDGSLVLDMCSAPGGKGIFGSLLNPHGVNVLNDVSSSRCQAIVNNVERMGLNNVVITNSDFLNDKIVTKFVNTFDYIILDAPCSGSGMFRKNKGMIDEWSINQVHKYAEIQKKLLHNAYLMLKPGGTLSYSTCSLSYEENEEVIQNLMNRARECIVEDRLPKGVKHHLGLIDDNGEGLCVYYISKPGDLEYEYKNINYINEIRLNGNKYVLNNKFDYKNLHVVRYGVKAYETIGKTSKPTHHLAKALNCFPTIEINDVNLIKRYVQGEQITINTASNYENGYVIITYKSLKVGLGKLSSNIIKNLYPKGLRHN